MVSTPFGELSAVLIGVIGVGMAGIIVALLVMLPNQRPEARRRLQATHVGESTLTRGARVTTDLIERAVRQGGRAQQWRHALDRAGIRQSLPEFVLLVGAATLVGLVVGLLLNGLIIGIFLALIVAVGAVFYVTFRAERRRRQFADQLDDLSQLLGTNLRAGHSLLQSLSALAGEVEEPARSELTRTVNQVRVGRDLGEALDETAQRMASEDFTWIAQAIAIHRQVGGNLADVLDTVSHTIRERNQVRRQVRALSAEGRMSAVILMGLPVVVGGILALVNPIYMRTFTQSIPGLLMLALCFILMTLGGLWMHRITQVKY